MANPKVYLQMLDETSGEYVNVDPRSCAEAITCNNNINLQNHLNTIYANQGDLSALTTTIKDNLVDAINELKTVESIATTYTATISTTWTGDSAPYTQTVTVPGITENDTPVVDVVLSDDSATALSQLEAWSCVSKITTGTNQITVTCLEEKPAVDIPIQLNITSVESTLINDHIGNAEIHMSSDEKFRLKNPFKIGVFAGNGASTRDIVFDIYPRIVFVIKRNEPFTKYDSSNGYTLINAGIVAANGGGGSAGLSLFLDTLTVSQSTSASDGEFINLNKYGEQYFYIAFK